MKRVFQHANLELALGVVFALMALGLLPASAWAALPGAGKAAEPSKTVAGCRDGWRRVGTVNDPTLKRSWAVVASCRHPAWPAHLEPASHWKALPQWVPAGSRVTVTAPGGMTSMRLEGKTLAPGRVGQAVQVRLIDGARVRARLTAADRAEMETGIGSGVGWRWR